MSKYVQSASVVGWFGTTFQAQQIADDLMRRLAHPGEPPEPTPDTFPEDWRRE